MDELDSSKFRFPHEDSVSLASSSTEASSIEESKYTWLQVELEADAQDLERESWSLVVDQHYLKPMSKESINRQDVIYELMQTEVHHVRTLKILLSVYRNELMDVARLQPLFNGLDHLLLLHNLFLHSLKQRRHESAEEGSRTNYQITRLADVLAHQFSDKQGDEMKECYAVFCYNHRDAITLYKELLQNNKKFQNHMRKVGQLSIVRRLGIPECFLLVTQRITKYPVLVERIIQNTEAGTEEHGSLVQALALIRDCISQVEAQVSEYEKTDRLKDITQRLEPKSQCLLKNGRLFVWDDLMVASRTLQHEAVFTVKESSGKHKEVLALLLTDVLILLQEKDQKTLVFKTIDNKSPVISLQSLIVREVANEDKAMFVIGVSPDNLVMYEIHTHSKAECNTWMAFIRQAVESCPTEEIKGEEEEEQGARSAELTEFQLYLARRDKLIVQNLTEKLQKFAHLSENHTGAGTAHNRLLLRGDDSDLQQGETLLMGAIKDVEALQDLLLARFPSRASQDDQAQNLALRRAQTFGGFDTKPPGSAVNGGEADESQARIDDRPAESREQSADDETQLSNADSPWLSSAEMGFFDHVLKLSMRLYSLQAIIGKQDSCADLLHARALTASASASAPAAVATASRRNSGDLLLEKERQRNLEKQREEQASFQQQQAQHRQQQQRWEKERERQQAHDAQLEAGLAEREEQCRRQEERLAGERAALEAQWEAYQGDLVRLRDSTQKVERERLQLEVQLQKQQKQSEQQFLRASQSFSLDRRVSPEPHADPASPATTTHNHHHRPNHSVGSRGGGGGGGGGGEEVPPTVPPRRHSMKPKPVEVPVQLVSTTNQPHKAGGVQQQIPTKLAVHSKGKTSKSSKGHHRGSHQRAASIDMSQVVPIKTTGKEGGSLRAKRSTSPQRISADRFTHQTPPNVKPSQSFSVHSKSHDLPPPLPPPFPKDLLKKEKGRVVFL